MATQQHSLHEPNKDTLSGADHAWLRMDSPVNPMVINTIMTFKTPISVAAFRQRIADSFVQIYRFRCCVDNLLISARWRESEPDLSYHLQQQPTPITDHSALQNLATEFINQPLQPDQPLWQMLFIPSYADGSAVIVRIHHAYADGMALMKVLLQLMDEGRLLPEFRQQPVKTKSSLTGSFIARLQPFLPGQGRWLETLALAEELTSEMVAMGLSSIEQNLFKTPGLCGKKQLVWTPPLRLDEVKTIAKFHATKVNDVLLSSAAGAFRRYFKSLNHLSAWSELRTVVPVDLRAQLNAAAMGNYFGLVFLTLPLGIADPIERARALHQRMVKLKTSKQAWLVYQILQLSGYLPDIAEQEIIRLFSSKASAVMTNVPGPPIPLHLAGSELDQILFWVPQSGSIGIGVSILTYNNRVQFGLMTDQQLVLDPESIIACFNNEFESLLLATLMSAPWPA